ncbi:MAG TPA: glutathione S-transferase family protein [Sphingomonas sp.]|nr:glutathione S-transferase family protein [Sphingomonas sp.]
MKIYGVIASPFVQRVLMAARLKGHDIAPEPPPGGALQSPEFQAISPMGRIPLLELDDGRRICESAAIVAYLDETLPGPALLPNDPVERAHARQIVSLAQCEVAAAGRPLMVHLVFHMGDAPEVVTAARAQLAKGLDAIEKVRVSSHRFAAGDRPGVADCILAPILTLLGIIDPMAGTGTMIAERPGLAAYMERAAADPVVGRSISEMTEAFKAMLSRIPAEA